MSRSDQAAAYLREATLTLESTRAVFHVADEQGSELWAQVVKNGYDAIEQAVSAAIAESDRAVPRRHPAKINAYVDEYDVSEGLEETLLYWLRRRSDSQYVDIRGDEVNVPHESFERADAERVVEDAATTLETVAAQIDVERPEE